MNSHFKNKFIFPYNYSDETYKFIQEYSYYINEVYISPMIEPFLSDMNAGKTYKVRSIEEYQLVIKSLIDINVKVNLVFNNVFVDNSKTDIFCSNLQSLLKNIDHKNITISLPNEIYFRKVRKIFKGIIKNTVINLITLNDTVKQYKNFDYIYLDDIYLKKLDQVKQLKELYGDKFIIISNHVGCSSACNVKAIHYKNLLNADSKEKLDNVCEKICFLKDDDWTKSKSVLTEAYIFPILSEYQKYASFFKYIKIRGRSDNEQLSDGMEIIKNIHLNNSILLKKQYLEYFKYCNIIKLKEWLSLINNCGGQDCFKGCYKCQEFIK